MNLDINKGDILLGGRFKNKRIPVKELGTDGIGQPTVNKRPLLNFRIEKKLPDSMKSSKTRSLMSKLAIAIPLGAIHNMASYRQLMKRLYKEGLFETADRYETMLRGKAPFKKSEEASLAKHAVLGHVKPPDVSMGEKLRSEREEVEQKDISPSLAKVIDKSQNPKAVVSHSADASINIYMGGNKAKDIRGALRDQQKSFRTDLKRRLGHVKLDMRSNF